MSNDVAYGSYMGGLDSLMWHIEEDPRLRSSSVGLLMLDRTPDPERMRAAVERTVAQAPRFRQIVTHSRFATAPPRFIPDPHFDLDFHFLTTGAAKTRDSREVLDAVGQLLAHDFDKDRPLWRFQLMTGLNDGGAALMVKVHHALTDAVGGLSMIFAPLIDVSREDAHIADLAAPGASQDANATGWGTLVREAHTHEALRIANTVRGVGTSVFSAMRAPRPALVQAVQATASLARSLAPARPQSPLMTGRSLTRRCDILNIPLESVRQAGKRAGGSLNDAFVAAVVDGLTRYHAALGAPAETLRMMMPVNLRDEATQNSAGNYFATAQFTVPLTIDDPGDRIRAVRVISAAARQEPSLRLFGSVASVLSRAPRSLLVPVYLQLATSLDFVTSNVPGPPFPILTAGAHVTEFLAFGPIAASALNITLMSYCGSLGLAVQSDPAAITDPDLLVKCLQFAFVELDNIA